MARIPPLPESEWDEDVRPILDSRMQGTDVRLGDNNIFTTLARHKGLFRAWLRLGGSCSAPASCRRASASC